MGVNGNRPHALAQVPTRQQRYLFVYAMYGNLPYPRGAMEVAVVSGVCRRERLEARVSPEQKALFLRAASLRGATLTEFLIASLQQAAETTIRTYEVIELTAQDSLAFTQALLEPKKPTGALVRAARRYQETTQAG